MKASYWQRGETLDYKNKTASIIEANTVISLGSRIGVVGAHIKPGEVGSLHVTGVFEMDKVASEEISMGTQVYFNGTAITATASGNTSAGYAAADAAVSDAIILVKLLG